MAMTPTHDENGHGETILVVEDNHAARVALEAILEALGYDVVMAADGEQALAYFRAHPQAIALVVSDLILPKMNGPELYAHLKLERADLQMLIMSGYPLEDESERLRQQGITHWIQKPFSMAQLAQELRATLADRTE
jgi:two-component system, cell cycle sensor histidine kinase and response regulator CckA